MSQIRRKQHDRHHRNPGKTRAQDLAVYARRCHRQRSGQAAQATKLPVISQIGKAATFVDPVKGALAVAKSPASAAKLAPYAQAFQTGKSSESFFDAFRTAYSGTAEERNAFLQNIKNPDIKQTLQKYNDAIQQIKNERNQNYVEGFRNATTGQLPEIPLNDIYSDLLNVADRAYTTDPATGVSRPRRSDAANAYKDIFDEIEFIRNQPAGSLFKDIRGLDHLKKTIGDIRDKYRKDPVANGIATHMYNSVLDSIKNFDPVNGAKYIETMRSEEHTSELQSH